MSESGECVAFVECTDILEGSPADYWEQELRRLEVSSMGETIIFGRRMFSGSSELSAAS